MSYREITRCRICGNNDLIPVLDLGRQALTGVFPKSRDHLIEEGPLQLVKCSSDTSDTTCGLVQLRHSYSPDTLYGTNYGYRSGLNPSMVRHLRQKAEAIEHRCELSKGDVVLDIGSNDGTFLSFLAREGVECVGMDPTGSKFKDYYRDDVLLIADFFSSAGFRRAVGKKNAKVVSSFSMFYDLESPMDFMSEVSEILAEDGIWVCEQSYLPAMIATTSYDTICHEHLEYYGLQQIQFMVERVGLQLIDVELNDVNGGSFSFTASKRGKRLVSHEVDRAMHSERSAMLNSVDTYLAFAERVIKHREEMLILVDSWMKSGRRLVGYGASTKGNVLLQFCGITDRQIPYIAEVNEDKFGSFTPGTGIPIVDEKWARLERPDGFLVLPWHFRKFIVEKEAKFLDEGGTLVFPLPQISEVNRLERRSANLSPNDAIGEGSTAQ